MLGPLPTFIINTLAIVSDSAVSRPAAGSDDDEEDDECPLPPTVPAAASCRLACRISSSYVRYMRMWRYARIWRPARITGMDAYIHIYALFIYNICNTWSSAVMPDPNEAARKTSIAVMQVSGGSQSFNVVNTLRLLGRCMRMITIPNQSSVPMAYVIGRSAVSNAKT